MEFTGNPNFGGSSQCENNWKYLKIIENIPLSRLPTGDRDGWHFTNNGRYTAKYDYQVKRVYPDRERTLSEYGPSVVPLKAFCWKIRCPPIMKHFLWQLIWRCIAVNKNLKARGMHGDTICARCGESKESINHVFFECPRAVQVWALSQIPSNPYIFPTQSLFANILFNLEVFSELADYQFAWNLWYIWKCINNKVFSNLDIDPKDTLKLAETK